MDHRTIRLTLFGIFVLLYIANGDVEIPFAHDFNTSLHGWIVGPDNWRWTGDSADIPDTTNITSFYSDGEYIWSQKHFEIPKPTRSLPQYLRYEFVKDATRHTVLNFTYWFHTQDPLCGFFVIYVKERYVQNYHLLKPEAILKNSDDWDTYTVDCDHYRCCENDRCDLHIIIYGSVGCSDGRGLIAIRSVSASSTDTTSTVPFKTWNFIFIFAIGINGFIY